MMQVKDWLKIQNELCKIYKYGRKELLISKSKWQDEYEEDKDVEDDFIILKLFIGNPISINDITKLMDYIENSEYPITINISNGEWRIEEVER